RRAIAGVPLLVAADEGPAEPARHDVDGVGLRAQRDLVAAPGLAPAVAVLHELVEDALALELAELHAADRVVARVGREVVAPRQRIGPAGVLVGRVGEFGLADALEDILELGRAVAV